MRTWYSTQHSRFISGCVITFVAVLLTVWTVQAQVEWPRVIASKDGTPISYEVYGAGEPTLIFVHGWSCDTRYWRHQVAPFSQHHTVVLVDLAGHGHSGATREMYSMRAFGEDVQAVAEATESQHVILIGHSMGGMVIAEAARLMPQRVKGLIGIDTLANIEYPLSREELDQMLAPFHKDFQAGTRQFVQAMLSPTTNAQRREWIMTDMSAAPPSVALSAMEEFMSLYITGHVANIFDELRIPVITVNGDMWPIDYEANRRHMFSFEAIVIQGADHFLMMNRPDEFNKALEQAIKAIVETEASK
ncbi:MAG: alpha/beta hydrolase [bacterium]|nr:alpha/beta hydrolase [bacterium]